jgi:Cu2+-exporting ATPase
MGTENHLDGSACRRDVARAVAGVDGVRPSDVDRAAARTVETATVGETHDHCVFEVTGLDCRTCAGLVECVLAARDGVSNATATAGHGTVRVDYDATAATPATLRAALADLGYPVETTDEAFSNRRAAQWREARLVTGVLAGLMAFAPYAAVVYPTRFAFWPAHPRVVALLERALETAFATHFYLNLALLSGIVLLVTGRPLLDDASASLRARRPDRDLALAAVVVGLYLYSTATAFLVSGGVYYDVVVVLVVGATVWRQAHRDPAAADGDAPESTAAAPATPQDGD